jgi:UDP-glucose 4-epimerase
MGKTALITGVNGFIGQYAARHFMDRGWVVVGLDTRMGETGFDQSLFHFHRITLPSEELIPVVQERRPQVCVHCAGPASVDLSMIEPAVDFAASVQTTFHLLDTLRRFAPECQVIYLSSAAVYGNPESLPIRETVNPSPISPYGFHKLVGETLCAEFSKVYGLPAAAVRIFSAYGVGLKRQVLWDICRKALTQPSVKLKGTGKESRDFVNVEDVARAIYLLAQKASSHFEIYNLASGIETTIKELSTLILDGLGLHLPVEFDGTITPGTPLNWRADISRLVRAGFRPEISLEKGIRGFTEWCRSEIQRR